MNSETTELTAEAVWQRMKDAAEEADGHKAIVNGRNYIPWASLADILYSRFPEAIVEWTRWGHLDVCVYPDGTASVECTVHIGPVSRQVSLPIRQGNVAKKNWDAFDVNTAKMRCFAKAVALHGLGLHLFTGEDIEAITRMEAGPEASIEAKPAESAPESNGNGNGNGKLSRLEYEKVAVAVAERGMELKLKPSEVNEIGREAVASLGFKNSGEVTSDKLDLLLEKIRKWEAF